MSRYQKGALFLLITMGLFSLGRLLLLLSYPHQFSELGAGLILQAFINGLRFDGAVVARIYAIPLLLMWLPFRLFDNRKWFNPLAWILYLLTLMMLLILAGDIIYFAHVNRHVSYELVLLEHDLAFLIRFALEAKLWIFLLFMLAAALLGWIWWRILHFPLTSSRFCIPKYIGLFFLLLLVGRGGPTGKVIEIIDAYGTGDIRYGNLSLNGVYTSIVFGMNMENINHHFFPQEQALSIFGDKDKILTSDFPLLRRYQAAPSGLNVVFILLESWNFEHVDSFGDNNFGVTPNFDALARDGLRFTRFYAAGQRSIEGIQATLTGIPALKGLPRIDAGIGISNFTRLGTIVKRHGYSSLFIQTSARDSFKISGIANAAGFEHFYGMEDISLRLDYPDPEAAAFGWDYDTLQVMKEKLDGLKPPFFAYAFTGTTHSPYPVLPSKFMLHSHDADGLNGYLNSLYYSDWSLGQFMEAARKSEWFDNTVFVFTSDHVSHLRKHDEIIREFQIPFLIYAPGHFPAEERRVVGSQLDVMPTIIDLLGLDEEFAAIGQSLLRKNKDNAEAFISLGTQQIGLITERGYVLNDLSQRIAGEGDEKSLSMMEQRLLAMDQLSYELLKENRWARQ